MTMMRTINQPPRLAGPAGRPPGPPSPTAGMGMTAREALRVVRRRKWLILLTLAICVGTAIVVTVLWRQYAPLYTAMAYLEVRPPDPVILDARTTLYSKDVIERYKMTQAALVKTQSVLEDAVRDELITAKGWYAKHRDDVIQALDEAIMVAPLPDTSLLRLRMTGTNKDELADIVNAVAKSFVRFSGQDTRQEIEGTIRKLQAERDDLQSKLERIRRDVAAAKGASAIAAMQERRSTIGIKLQMLTQQSGEAEIAQSQAEAGFRAQQKEIEDGNISKNIQVLRILEMDPQARGLSLQLTELKTRLSNALHRFGRQHRNVRSLEGLIESIETQLEQRREEVLKDTIAGITQLRQMELAGTTQQLADLTERLNLVKAEARDLEVALGRIGALSQEADYLMENIRRIDQRVLDMRTQLRGKPGQQRRDIGPVSIGAYATVPREISHPKWKITIPVGLFAGLALGFGLAFLLEFADTSVRSPGDLARRVDLPLLGMVPHSDDLDEEIEDFRRVTLLAPHSPATEAFRQIRTNLLFSGPVQQRRSLLITSPAPEDGRTTVVMNLAASMAQAGRRVLVVDANFRQPAIAAMFPEAAAAGLSSALVGQAAWRDVVSHTDVPNCDVIAAGPLPPNPAELLGSDTMRQLIGEMTAEYDQVLFDGSPTMVVSDARVLATQVDGVILVVRAGSNSVGIVQRAAEQLQRVGAHVLGVVLQAVRTTAGGYLQKNYQTFYEYHQKSLP